MEILIKMMIMIMTQVITNKYLEIMLRMMVMMMVTIMMQVITNKYLEIRTLDFGSFVYNITAAPVHGWISVLAPNKVKEFKKSDIFVLLLQCVSLGTENDPKIGDKKAIVLSALPNQRCAQTILAVSSRPPVGKVQIQCQRAIRSRYLCQKLQKAIELSVMVSMPKFN